MAKILTSDCFPKGDEEYGVWERLGNLIDGNYANSTGVRKGGHYHAQHITYYYKFSITPDDADALRFVAWPGYHSLYTLFIGLYYGDEENQTKIGNTWEKTMTNALTPNKPENGGNPMEIDFGLTDADRLIIKQNCSKLMLGLYVTGSYTGTMHEIDIIVPDRSKIYVGDAKASAVYVGGTKAKAVYVGTTKVL